MNTPLTDQEELAQIALSGSNLVFVTGTQWWDEGKWKAVSAFQWRDIRYIVGVNGGGNAGHTVHYQGNALDFHELPGGAIIEGATIYLAKGRVIQISTLGKEMEKLRNAWIGLENKIVIGGGAQVIFKSFQQKIDADIEKLRGWNAVGTTMKWIGPAYAGEALRIGLTIKELLTMSDMELSKRIDVITGLFVSLDRSALESEVKEERTKLQWWISAWHISLDHDDMMMYDAVSAWDTILVEQSQSFLLGKEWWAYPYCTSSDSSVNGMYSYLNLPHTAKSVVIGTAKAIMSKVGGGCLSTKMWHDEEYGEFEKQFARDTGEKWVTTGRLRDLWWVDLPALRHALSINPIDILVVTKGDVLATLAEAQRKAGLSQEMRFYQNYTDPTTGQRKTSGLSSTPNTSLDYTTIRLSPSATELNIKNYGSQIRKDIPSFTWPIFFWNGPREDQIQKYA